MLFFPYFVARPSTKPRMMLIIINNMLRAKYTLPYCNYNDNMN